MIEDREPMLDLFDEYASAYVAGQRPDVLAFVERAGAEAGAFARMVDAFLQSAPLQAADALVAARIDARLDDEPTLLSLRKRLRLGLDEVAVRLGGALGLPAAAAARVGRRYQELELGALDPGGVQETVWSGLRAVFGVDVRGVVGGVLLPLPAPAAPAPAAAASFRRAKESPDLAEALDADVVFAAAGPDPVAAEVDRLFGI